jgi:hypothetical protein
MSASLDMSRDFKATNQYIAYFDILGYESMIRTDEDISDLAKKIYLCLKTLEDDNQKYPHLESPEDVKYKVFSDNFFLCSKKGWLPIVWFTAMFQRYLIRHGVFIRGAMCYDKIYFSDDFICGGGIVSVHKLENEIAIFPRIIVADSFFRAAESDYPNIYNIYPIDKYNAPFSRDFDDQVFLNYINLGNDSSDYPIMSEARLKRFEAVHKEKIELRLFENRETPRILQKYQWCKNYHNEYCKAMGFTEFLFI